MKIYIVGSSCSGKTTLSRKIAAVLQIPHLELDQIWWLPGWQECDRQEFRKQVEDKIAANKDWVIDGNYSRVQDLILPEANLIIWLNLPFLVVFWRSIYRTISRIISREIICNGNQEDWRSFFSRDSMPAWVIRTWKLRLDSCYQLKSDDKRVIELKNSKNIEHFLKNIENIAIKLQ